VQLTTVPRHARATSRGLRPWARIIGVTGAVLAVGASTLALTTSADALDTRNIGPADAATGFPSFYTDNAGVSVQQCIDGTARCGGATARSDGAGGPGIAVAPDGEGFYWSAEANLNSARGSLRIILAHEGAWATPTQRLVFDRLRVRGTLSQPGRYTLLTPYGTTRVVAEAGGVVNQTSDPACAQAAGGTCSPRFTNWLRAVNAPVGYLGNSVSATPFTGGKVRNAFILKAPNGKVVGRTKRAIILGKLVDGGAAVLSDGAVDFGNSAKVVHRRLQLKNQGNGPLALQGIAVAGAKNISVDRTGCAARATLASGASCAVSLTYRPGRLNASAGSLVIRDNTAARVHRVPVKAKTSSEFSARRAVRFKTVKVRSSSKTRRVVVTNTGVQPLKIKGVSITGSGAKSFERRTGKAPVCAKGSLVKPRASCAFYVGFVPKTFGAKTATLKVRTNAASSPDQVRLSGRGR